MVRQLATKVVLSSLESEGRMKRALIGCLVASVVVFGPAGHAQGQQSQKILIRASKPYADVEGHVRAVGGRVTRRFTHIDAVAAEVL